ncbi:MAG: DUF2721 domain-containing protein [Planctomycetota bacterium]
MLLTNESLTGLLGPVVLISADALLCMSTSARLSTVLARVRELHRELLGWNVNQPQAGAGALLDLRREGLERQSTALIERATRLRNALVVLYGSICLLVVSGLLNGLAPVVPSSGQAWMSFVGMTFAVLGLAAVGLAAAWLMLDMRHSVEAVRFEHERIGRGMDR